MAILGDAARQVALHAATADREGLRDWPQLAREVPRRQHVRLHLAAIRRRQDLEVRRAQLARQPHRVAQRRVDRAGVERTGQASPLRDEAAVRDDAVDDDLLEVRHEQHVGIAAGRQQAVEVRDLPVHRVVDGGHLVRGDGIGTPSSMAVRTSWSMPPRSSSSATVRSSTARPTLRQSRKGRVSELLDHVGRALCLQLQVHAFAKHGQGFGDARRVARHDAGRDPPVEHVQRRAAMARDDAAIVERGLDDAVQAGRAVEHARQIHHLVDAARFLGPPLEGECRFGVADMAARRFDGARRRGRRYARVDLLRQPAACLDEILDARKSCRRIRDLVRALEVGRQPLGQGDLGMPARAQATALAVVVRVDEAGDERHALRVDPDGRGADVPRNVADRGDPIAGDGDAPAWQQFARDGVEQGAAFDDDVGGFLRERHAHQAEPGADPRFSVRRHAAAMPGRAGRACRRLRRTHVVWHRSQRRRRRRTGEEPAPRPPVSLILRHGPLAPGPRSLRRAAAGILSTRTRGRSASA